MFKDNQEKPYIIIFLAMLIINDFRLLIIKQTIKQTTNRLLIDCILTPHTRVRMNIYIKCWHRVQCFFVCYNEIIQV